MSHKIHRFKLNFHDDKEVTRFILEHEDGRLFCRAIKLPEGADFADTLVSQGACLVQIPEMPHSVFVEIDFLRTIVDDLVKEFLDSISSPEGRQALADKRAEHVFIAESADHKVTFQNPMLN